MTPRIVVWSFIFWLAVWTWLLCRPDPMPVFQNVPNANIVGGFNEVFQ